MGARGVGGQMSRAASSGHQKAGSESQGSTSLWLSRTMPPRYSKHEPWLCFLLPDKLGLFSLNNHINYQKHLAQPNSQKPGRDNAQFNHSGTTGQKTALAVSSLHSVRTMIKDQFWIETEIFILTCS